MLAYLCDVVHYIEQTNSLFVTWGFNFEVQVAAHACEASIYECRLLEDSFYIYSFCKTSRWAHGWIGRAQR
jgi:hypothetical protein